MLIYFESKLLKVKRTVFLFLFLHNKRALILFYFFLFLQVHRKKQSTKKLTKVNGGEANGVHTIRLEKEHQMATPRLVITFPRAGLPSHTSAVAPELKPRISDHKSNVVIHKAADFAHYKNGLFSMFYFTFVSSRDADIFLNVYDILASHASSCCCSVTSIETVAKNKNNIVIIDADDDDDDDEIVAETKKKEEKKEKLQSESYDDDEVKFICSYKKPSCTSDRSDSSFSSEDACEVYDEDVTSNINNGEDENEDEEDDDDDHDNEEEAAFLAFHEYSCSQQDPVKKFMPFGKHKWNM